MKLQHEPEEATKDRKLMKSQVEKRRRERMNSSLERLRTMLLQEPQHLGGTHGRVEKAEILQHTVLFLQRSSNGDKPGAGANRGASTGAAAGGGGQKQSFQDGFSACLQRATHFLGPQGKGLWLRAAMDAYSSAHAGHSNPDTSSFSSGFLSRTEPPSSSTTTLTRTKSILRMLRQKSKHRLRSSQGFSVNVSPHPYQCPVQQAFPRLLSPPQTQSQQNMSHSSNISQTLWRPWP